MKIIFCTSDRIGAKLIRFFTWSDWSHVALIHGNSAIEAVYPEVRVTPLEYLKKTHPYYQIVDVPCWNDGYVINSALSQVGKPYDVSALFGIIFHRNWKENDKWFCSEFVSWCLERGGVKLFRKDVLNRVTPQHLWMLPFSDINEV